MALRKTGTVDFDPEINASLLPEHLASCLRSVDANDVQVTDKIVAFRGGIFRFVTNWNVLVAFGSGDLTIDPKRCKVQYCVSYGQFVILALITAFVVAAYLLIVGGLEATATVLGLLFFCFAAVSLNLVWRIYNFKRFLRRSLTTAPHKAVGIAALY